MKRTDLTEVSDAALVMRISRYQQDALAEAYRRHAGAVFGLSRRLLSDAAMAEEIVQEVFLRLWNEPEKFDPGRGSAPRIPARAVPRPIGRPSAGGVVAAPARGARPPPNRRGGL